MISVTVRELKNRLSMYLRLMRECGEHITVTRRGKPVATLSPVCEPEADVTRKLHELAARGVIHWSGGKPKGLPRPVKLRGKGPTVSEMVLEDRGEPLP